MAGVLLQGAWFWYQRQLFSKPLRTQIASSGLLWAAGDVIAQGVTSAAQQKTARSPSSVKEVEFLDWKRVATTSLFGIGFVGPIGHFWYEGLEYVVKHKLQLKPSTFRFLAAKLVADTLIFGPVHLLAFFSYSGLMCGRSFKEIKEDLNQDFIPAFMTEGAVWPIVQALNFKYVPVQHQLLYVNCFCLIDSAFLSWFKYQDDAPWKKRLKSLIASDKK